MPAILAPDTLFHGRYHVVRCLSVGGMGAVYEVVDKATESRRALKVLLPDTLESADLRRRFEREATITGAIESDHIVRTTDAGLDEATGMPFLVMELLRGEELAAVVARAGHLPPKETLLHLRQAALGLDKVHAAGIVHRDLKPENLFVVRRDDGSSCLKIIDFGVAKELAPSAEIKKTRAIGTPLFMAPEQMRGDGRLGPGADLYALGHVAYMLLTGEPYWNEEADSAVSVQAFVRAVAEGALEPASKRALRRRGVLLPPSFDGWFARATAILPEDRFRHAMDAVEALTDALEIPGAGQSAELPPKAPLWSRTTAALTREPSPHPSARSWPRLGLPVLATTLVILGMAALASALLAPGSDKAAAAPPSSEPSDPAPAASSPSTPAAPEPVPTHSSSLAPVDTAPPAASSSAMPSASAASKPRTAPAPRPARPPSRPRPSGKNLEPHYPGID